MDWLPSVAFLIKTVDHPALADKSARIVIYCRSGGRASLAALNLQRLGYARIESVAGGIEAWKAAGQPIIADTTSYTG